MKHLKRTLLTLVALLAVMTGAWAEVQYPIVYDFEAAANAGENPDNKNGSAANGQKFYGWENAEKPDKDRQDYKGYEWAEGSKLPEVCHVWRRSDRINGNVAGQGGLKCPSNKEIAIDGLTAGLAVTFIYDNTAAADGSKELLWAIGDGSSDGGPGHVRATATINGVDAVPGQTTIKSGDMIIVNSVTEADNGTGYIVVQIKKGMILKKVIIDVAPAPTPVTFTRGTGDKANEWTLDGGMPAGNVEVNVAYYPQATAAADAVTAATGVKATTDDALLTVDASKLTGASGLMYYVSTTATATAPAYDAEGWTDQVPTAKDILTAGDVYVWYYPVGQDDADPANTYSDGDMNATALTVTVLPEPTYNVEFAEGIDDAAKWSATPNTGLKKGETVTITYSGERKVIGVKAEKKKILVTKITLSESGSTTKTHGESGTLRVTSIEPEDADDKTYTWSSDDPYGVSIDQNGHWSVVGRSGSVTLRATANDGSGVSASLFITVRNN